MNKSALLAFNELIWVIRLIIVIIVLTLVTVTYFYTVDAKFSTEATELEIFAGRILIEMSDYDPLTGRTNIGVINPNKNWQDNIMFAKDYVATKVKLNGSVQYYNKLKYDDWYILRKAGGAVAHQKSYLVLMHEDGTLVPKTLSMELVTPQK